MKQLATMALMIMSASTVLAASAVRIDGVAAHVNEHTITASDVLKTSRSLQEQISKGEDTAKLNKAYLAAVKAGPETVMAMDEAAF